MTKRDSRRVPVPVDDMLERLHLPKASPRLPPGVRIAEGPGQLLEDFRPIATSLEWRLARS